MLKPSFVFRNSLPADETRHSSRQPAFTPAPLALKPSFTHTRADKILFHIWPARIYGDFGGHD